MEGNVPRRYQNSGCFYVAFCGSPTTVRRGDVDGRFWRALRRELEYIRVSPRVGKRYARELADGVEGAPRPRLPNGDAVYDKVRRNLLWGRNKT